MVARVLPSGLHGRPCASFQALWRASRSRARGSAGAAGCFDFGFVLGMLFAFTMIESYQKGTYKVIDHVESAMKREIRILHEIMARQRFLNNTRTAATTSMATTATG
jgi:hypothetical protein